MPHTDATPTQIPTKQVFLTEPNPRPKIREFLQDVFNTLQFDPTLTADWPTISPQDYRRLYGAFRVQLDQLYAHLERQNTLTRDQMLSARLFGESAIALLRLDWERPFDYHQPSPQALDALQVRPISTMQYDQLYCTPDSTERRNALIMSHIDPDQGRILFMGDDDLCSLALAPHVNGEVHMFDIDQRLIDFINEREPSVHTHLVDLELKGVPRRFYQHFDAVLLDPPWEYLGTWFFLNKAIYCLKDDIHARLYLSYCPLYLEHKDRTMARFQRRLTRHGFCFDTIIPYFNLYDISMDVAPEFRSKLDSYVPPNDSALFDLVQRVPYGFSHLYVLRRIPNFKPNPIRHFLFKWWNAHDDKKEVA